MCSTSNLLTRRGFVFLAIFVLLTVSTAALAHSHPSRNTENDSQCAMCMALHGATHIIASPVVTLNFEIAQTGFITPSKNLSLPVVQSRLTQDRAPPRL
jgi:hypothetical protein